ncbi:ABC transporter permease [Paenibacillus solisilvae]|uniref:ABC transporter permease n=1 Tax=Paenibacillus solisilvae TaxID=2486751 RepID=A0ABW0VXD1_9BACL
MEDVVVKGVRKKTVQKKSVLKLISRDKYLLLFLLPVVVHLFIFSYLPILGISVAFRDYRIGDPFLAWGSDAKWVGLKHFIEFVNSMYFVRILRNTFFLSALFLIFGFWVPIVFSIFLNEIRHSLYKKVIQTMTFMPHFISTVVIVGIVVNFVSIDGIVNSIIQLFGGNREQLLNNPQYFRVIFIVSTIWQTFGWGSLLYLAAIAGIDPGQYESARMDGANRWKQAIHITLPGITPTIVILLLFTVGRILSTDTDKVLLMYNPSIYETADVIGTYTYRTGLLEGSFSYASAIGFFSAVVNFILLIFANSISRRYTEYGLW